MSQLYEFSKRLVKQILPKNIGNHQKRKMRKLVGFAYRGNRYKCNICGLGFRTFISLSSGDMLCPNCGSLPRTRGLWNYIQDKIENKIVLHFSPSSSVKYAIEKQGHVKEYITTDYIDEFDSELTIDIEDIKLKDRSVDVIICYHILEHVENDGKALGELFRVLDDNGLCYIQTPFKEGEIFEDPNIMTPKERLKYFGQEDHVRIYSASGLENRMTLAGFTTEKIETRNETDNFGGFKTKDIVLIGKKDIG